MFYGLTNYMSNALVGFSLITFIVALYRFNTRLKDPIIYRILYSLLLIILALFIPAIIAGGVLNTTPEDAGHITVSTMGFVAMGISWLFTFDTKKKKQLKSR